jgi:hypothetical protein
VELFIQDECLDKLLILNQAHLRRVLCEYIAYYNDARLHQGLDQQAPISWMIPKAGRQVQCSAGTFWAVFFMTIIEMPPDATHHRRGFWQNG